MYATLDASPASPAIDLDELIEICMGDKAFARSLFELFLRDSEANLAKLRGFALGGNCAAAAIAAHALKGSAAVVAAKAVQRVAAEIQTAGEQEQAAQLVELVEDLAREIGSCRAFLRIVRNQAGIAMGQPRTRRRTDREALEVLERSADLRDAAV